MKTYPIAERENKVSIQEFGVMSDFRGVYDNFLMFLPHVGATSDFRNVIFAIVGARKKGKPVIAMMGAHVIKCGCSPYIIRLMKEGVITAVAMNGAAAIHDFEIGLIGATSEPVEKYLPSGKFGMWQSTGHEIHRAIRISAQSGKDILGMGGVLGSYTKTAALPFRRRTILYKAWEYNIPLTVHVAIGTDTIHQHPDLNSRIYSGLAFRDFFNFVDVVRKLHNGSVVLNFGSAVIMPEIFLKALNMARNEGHEVKDFVTANFDMIAQYRAIKNVVERPHIGNNGRGYNIIGMHEIMIPLLTYAVLDKMEDS